MSKTKEKMNQWETEQLKDIQSYTAQLVVGPGEKYYFAWPENRKATENDKRIVMTVAHLMDAKSQFGRRAMVHAITVSGRSIIIPRD